MNYTDVENLSISEVNFFDIRFQQILKKKGIENLSQLFEAYDKGSLRCGRDSSIRKDIKSLIGITELLKYKYYGTQLLADINLELVSYEEDKFFCFPGTKNLKDSFRNFDDILRLGFTWDEFLILNDYFDKEINKENISLINVLQQFFNDKSFCERNREQIICYYNDNEKEKAYNLYLEEISILKNKISIILDYYMSKNKIEANNDIQTMRDKLDELIKTRNILDAQISFLTTQINSLSQEDKVIKK